MAYVRETLDVRLLGKGRFDACTSLGRRRFVLHFSERCFVLHFYRAFYLALLGKGGLSCILGKGVVSFLNLSRFSLNIRRFWSSCLVLSREYFFLQLSWFVSAFLFNITILALASSSIILFVFQFVPIVFSLFLVLFFL
jgi:hypothetical protein